MGFSPAELEASLVELGLPTKAAVAFSGGGDSTALLHASARLGLDLRALHVHHGLHPEADAWAAHCEAMCRELGVPLRVLRVSVEDAGGHGLEAAARRARYRALRGALHDGECLFTAHTHDDQSETVLLQLLRGAGLAGLAGMVAVRPFGPGVLARPLLEFSRSELRSYLEAAGAAWLEDPDNRNLEHSRVYLRREVMPVLERRWPAATTLISRASRNLAESRVALDGLAASDLAACRSPVGEGLRVGPLAGMGEGRRRALLRHWIARRTLPEPSRDHLLELERQALAAREDAEMRVAWAGAEVVRYRGVLYARRPGPEVTGLDLDWRSDAPLTLPGGLGRLSLEAREGEPPAWRFGVRLRTGGERIRLPGRAHHTDLKQLFQDWGVPPWERRRIPLLFRRGELVSVGDLQASAEFGEQLAERGLALRWSAD